MLGIFADMIRHSTTSRRSGRNVFTTDPHERRPEAWAAPDHWMENHWTPRQHYDRERN